jgi:uncharacterized protein YdeI (YjbR/CyaY-like superfamily)
MIKQEVVHKVPADLKKELVGETLEKWNSLTPLGRNEYICWITSAKKDETRQKRIDWMKGDILKGKDHVVGLAAHIVNQFS